MKRKKEKLAIQRYIDADELKKCSFVIAYKDERNITQYGEFVEVVRCKDCIHRPTDTGGHNYGQDMEFPDDICPCQVGDHWYSWMPKDNWFCGYGERREDVEKSNNNDN